MPSHLFLDLFYICSKMAIFVEDFPMRSLPTLCALILLSTSCWRAQATININTDAVQKTVVFIYGSDAKGAVDQNQPMGTGFLVGVPLKSERQRLYPFLITARHILDPSWAKCGRSNPSVVYARVNKKDFTPDSGDPGFDFIPIKLLDNGMPIWWHSVNDAVDVAVARFPIDQEHFDVDLIPVEMFPTDAETSAQSIGDPVMSAGLLPLFTGSTRNHPIFKFGQISNIPTENIETRCVQQMPPFKVKVWLIAANLVPGNSGSPIFHVPLGGGGVSLGGTRPMLLGVQSISFLGADVAGMAPISFVYEILQSMNLPDADFRRGPPPPVAPK
jgi:hypothetical protein